MKLSRLLLLAAALLPASAHALPPQEAPPGPRVALIKMPYRGARNVEERSGGPDYLEAGGLADTLRMAGWDLASMATVALTAEDEREYGEWHRLGLANGHLADMVADNARDGVLSVGLLGNCASLMGMLGGLQHGGPIGEPRRVGLIYIDAHGDFNTPETTASGFLDGMALAAVVGRCWRDETATVEGFRPLPEGRVALAGARDLDSAEAELLAGSEVSRITAGEIRARGAGAAFGPALDALAAAGAARVYLHLDLDVLDPGVARVNAFAAPGGLALADLTAAVAAIGARLPIAAAALTAYDPEVDADGAALAAALAVLRAVATAAG
ncbi:MAG TPA: arginase family protein [Longimicrobiales bacterium]